MLKLRMSRFAEKADAGHAEIGGAGGAARLWQPRYSRRDRAQPESARAAPRCSGAAGPTTVTRLHTADRDARECHTPCSAADRPGPGPLRTAKRRRRAHALLRPSAARRRPAWKARSPYSNSAIITRRARRMAG